MSSSTEEPQDQIDENLEEEEESTEEGGNLLANLREKRKEISEARHLDLEIPGYDGELIARYVPVEWDEVKKIGEKLNKSKNPRRELYAQADVLARCCDQILVRVKGKLKSMGDVFPELGVERIAFDPNLAQALDFEINSHSPARSAVLQAFNNDMAVSAQHTEVMEWIQSSSREDDQDF